jgi:hypothetical protein
MARYDYRPNQDIESKLESRHNMYERQIDQLFDFTYRTQDDNKTLFGLIHALEKKIELKIVDKEDSINQMNQLKICIQNYYHLELENKRHMEYIDYYQFQSFIVIIIIIVYLICLRFSIV